MSKVLNIEDHEWKELTKGHTADIKARKALYAEIHRKGIECMKEFDRTHPGYFDETGLVVCSEKTKKNPTNVPIRASAEISLMEIRRLAPQTVQHLYFPTTWQVQNIVSRYPTVSYDF